MAKTKEDPKIRTDYKPTDKEYELLQMVYQRRRDMEDAPHRQDAMKQVAKAWKQWESLRETKAEDDWQSNHVVPITNSIVETLLSEVIDQSPQPIILPRGSEDAPRAMVMKNIFNYTWEIADGDLELYNVLKDAFVTGTGIAQEYYWRDARRIKTKKKEKGEGWEEKDIFDYEDCYMESVRLEDFYVDEKARAFSGPYAARDCIRRYIMNIEDFKQFFKGDVWDSLKNVQYVIPGGDNSYYEFYSPPDGINKEKDVEVLWYWSVKPDDWLIVVANDVLVFMGPNPYKHKQLPFARAIDTKRPHHFYGKGQAEMLESIQDELNTIRRMTIDRSHLDIDKMFFVSSRLNLSDEDLVARPHGMIPVDDVNASKPVEYGDTPRSVELTLQHLEDDATIVTGVNPRAQALPQSGTATEAAILKESTLKRVRLKIKLLEMEFLVRIARLRVANIMQYYSQPKLEKIIGDEKTDTYKKMIDELKGKGLLVEEGNEKFKKSYKPIRLENKQINFDEKGTPIEKPNNGYSFFEAMPDYFMPVARGGYDIKIAAGSTLPVSKTLEQTKAMETFDRLAPFAAQGIGWDIVKLGDNLLEKNDQNPNDFHLEKEGQDEDAARLQMQVELATTENKLMMGGKQVPSTAFVSPIHTRIHVSFTQSPQFQQLQSNDPRIQAFIDHITGELAAQSQRQGGSMEGGAAQQPPTTPLGNGTQGKGAPPIAGGNQKGVSETIPAMITGGAQAPVAI
jgi:hypothetical protein